MESIDLRPAQLEDQKAVFQWRNHPEVRKYNFDPNPLEWEGHVEWFKKTLNDPGRHLLIGESEGQPVGVLRIDSVEENVGEISVYLVPGKSGQGLGSSLIGKGIEWVGNHLPQIKRLRAKILGDNAASQKAFHRAGFEESHRLYEWRAP